LLYHMCQLCFKLTTSTQAKVKKEDCQKQHFSALQVQ
jgi:hypothetical protein